MIRLLGGLVGAALAIALLLLLVGIPQFRVPSVDLENAIVTLPLRTAPVEPVDTDAIESDPMPAPPAVPAPTAQIEPEQPAQVAVTADATDTGIPAEYRPTDDSLAAPPDASGDAADLPALSPGWYTFWSPFRSEIAAMGFVSRLQSVTGLDYRVDKLEAGVYQVAFAYHDETEIAAKLSEITTATGLELASR